MNKDYTSKKMIKTKLTLILILQLIFVLCSQAQLIQLFNENFETGGGTFTLNSVGVGSNSGNNLWIVNNNYFPSNLTYPITIDQDQVCSNGHITLAPFGHYLHINNNNLPTNFNSDYDPTQASDRFAYLTNGICTMGMDSVTVAFFYNCQGSPTAYAQVYYSINGGLSWIQTGQPQYHNNSTCWQYETITSSSFANVSSLQIGFRWINDASSTDTVSQAMGIDDIFIVGVSRPNITDSITQIFPNPVCQNSSLFIQVALSDTLCDGTYSLELSDSTGNFANLTANYVIDIFNPQTTTFVGINITSAMHTGPCYRVRVSRLYPLPAFTGPPSPCIVVEACPNTITTLQPVVTMDTNAVCVGSVIDIPFYSSGTFHYGNNYIAQLSDSAGNFPANPTVINTNFGDSTTYVYPPGTVSGLVPDVPDGCHYYVRVVGTNPQPTTIGTVFGPFCIQHCDINTNEHQSLAFCLTPNDTTINSCLDVDVHSFSSDQVYLPGNIFKIELLSTMNLSLVGTIGALGQQAATSDTLVCIHIAGLAGLSAMGIAPGAYYLRVVATNTLYGDSSLGNIIHFTLGAPPDTGLTVTGLFYNTFDSIKGHVCPGDILLFEPHPWDFTASYEWYGNFVGDSLMAPDIAITIGGSFFDFIVKVREISFGCRGPASNPDTVIVDGLPQVNIGLPTFVCVHDTNQWVVPYGQNTYYDWTSVHGSVLDTSNNTVKIRFDTAGGPYVIKVYAVNHCGSSTGQKNITVKDYPAILSPIDTTICSSTPIKFINPTGSYYSYLWTSRTGTLGTLDSLIISPQSTDTIFLLVQQTQAHCKSYDTIIINVLQAQVSNHVDSLCLGDTLTLIPNHTGQNYLWNTGSTSHNIVVTSSGKYFTVITSPDSLCAALDTFHVTTVQKIVRSSVDSICVGDTIVLDATNPGASYLWNAGGQTSRTIKIDSGGVYVAQIHYAGNVCTNLDSFTVIKPQQFIYSNADSLCPGDSIALTAANDGSLTYIWNTGQTSQSINVYWPGTYYSYHMAPGARCMDADTFKITWKNCATMTLPNVFSPNGDGKNDFFLPMTIGVYTTFHIQIYDRWGLMIWESTDPDFHWPGVTKNGGTCPDGTYYYVVSTTYENKSKAWHGFVTLIR